MTSEYSNVGIKFEFDESGYNRHYITLFGMDMERFALFVKTFLMFSMGRYILETLQKAVNELEEALQSMTQTITDAYDDGFWSDSIAAIPYYQGGWLAIIPDASNPNTGWFNLYKYNAATDTADFIQGRHG